MDLTFKEVNIYDEIFGDSTKEENMRQSYLNSALLKSAHRE